MKRPHPPTSDRDVRYALSILWGMLGDDGKTVFPSRNTSPTEKDAREALARILRNGDAPTYLLKLLADAIELNGNHPRRIEFKNLSQGHPQAHRKFMIANRVRDLRKKNEKNAVEKVAKEFGMHPRNVAKIWSELREQCEYVERLKRGGASSRTDVTASDK